MYCYCVVVCVYVVGDEGFVVVDVIVIVIVYCMGFQVGYVGVVRGFGDCQGYDFFVVQYCWYYLFVYFGMGLFDYWR